MKARSIVVATAVLFALGVWALTAFGKGFLHQVSMCDTTVDYLDLARQASDHRDYDRADAMYKQALMYARQNDPSGQAENAMLLSYAKFAYEKKHDRALAMQLQARAAELRQAAEQANAPGAAGEVR
jgi:hypothetical protein